MIKLLEFMGKAKIVWPLILVLWAGTVFALDTRYLTLVGYANGTVLQIQREISILEIKLGFAKNADDKQLIRALIAIKKQQIKEVR